MQGMRTGFGVLFVDGRDKRGHDGKGRGVRLRLADPGG
jgi:hypothetical protein